MEASNITSKVQLANHRAAAPLSQSKPKARPVAVAAVRELQVSQVEAQPASQPATASWLMGSIFDLMCTKAAGYAAVGIVAGCLVLAVRSAGTILEMGSCIAPLTAQVHDTLWKVVLVSIIVAHAGLAYGAYYERSEEGYGVTAFWFSSGLAGYMATVRVVPKAVLWVCSLVVPSQPGVLWYEPTLNEQGLYVTPVAPDVSQYQACMDRFHLPALITLCVGMPIFLMAAFRVYEVAVTRRF